MSGPSSLEAEEGAVLPILAPPADPTAAAGENSDFLKKYGRVSAVLFCENPGEMEKIYLDIRSGLCYYLMADAEPEFAGVV